MPSLQTSTVTVCSEGESLGTALMDTFALTLESFETLTSTLKCTGTYLHQNQETDGNSGWRKVNALACVESRFCELKDLVASLVISSVIIKWWLHWRRLDASPAVSHLINS